MAQRQDVASEGRHVVGQTSRLRPGVKPPHQPAVVGRHTRGAITRVALLGLDAADGEHCFACYRDEIAAHGQGDDRAVRKTQLAAADPHHLVRHADGLECPVDACEADLEGQGDMVREGQRRCAGAALGAVDGDEVWALATLFHALCEVLPEPDLADGALDPDR